MPARAISDCTGAGSDLAARPRVAGAFAAFDALRSVRIAHQPVVPRHGAVATAAFIVLLMEAASVVLAQDSISAWRLGSPTASMSGFEDVRTVRELANGTVVVTSGRTAAPVVAHLERGVSSAISREGDGPGEFRQPSTIWALLGDSSLVLDLRRWVVLIGDQPTATLRSWLAGVYPPRIRGFDRLGRVLEVKPAAYGAQPGTRVAPTHRNATSLVALLHRRAPVASGEAVTGRPDTLVRLRGAYRGVRRIHKSLPGFSNVTYELVQDLSADDQAVLFQDGWVAIAYADPYRVDWYDPSGRKTTGGPLPFERVPVDLTQKRAALARSWPSDPNLFKPEDYPPWPEVLPPFLVDAILPAPDGSLLIRRTPDAYRPGTRYDIVSRQGVLVGRLLLRANEWIVGFGQASAYVIRETADGLQFIERYSWPPRA